MLSSTIHVSPGGTFGWEAVNAPSGVTMGASIYQGIVEVEARSTDVVAEAPTGSGRYVGSWTAPDAVGSYELVMDDGAGVSVQYELVVGVASPLGVLPPTGADVRMILPRVDWTALGYPPATGGGPDSLDFEAGFAVDYVVQITGRPQDETMPPELVRIAQKADALRTLQSIYQDSNDSLDALGEGQFLSGFSSPGYSETYRDPGASQKALEGADMVNPWPELNRLLWLLMTPERQAYWIAFLRKEGLPAYGVIEMDWSGANRWGIGPVDPGSGGLPGDTGDPGSAFPLGGAAWPTGSYPGIA